MTATPWIVTEQFGDVTVVIFYDKKLENTASQEIGDDLSFLVGVEIEGKKNIALNLEHVILVRKGVWGKFIALNKKIEIAGGKLVIYNMNEAVSGSFQAMQLEKIITVKKDKTSVLEFFR